MSQAIRSVPRMLSIAELADRCSVSTKTVSRWIQSGDLHVHRVRGRVLIAEDDAASFLATNRR